MDNVETTADAVDQLPDAGNEMSFENSLEKAFAALEEQPDVVGDNEPQIGADDDVSESEEESEEYESEEVESEEAEEVEEVEEAEDNNDPIESLDDSVEDWTPKAANRFKELKAELKTNRSELEELRQKATEYESKIQELTGLAESKDIEELQTKLAEYEQQQALSNLENTEAYKQAVTEPLAALMEQADQIADKYEIDSDALVDVLALDDPEAQEQQLAALLPNASDRDKARLFRIMEEVDPILERRSQLYENADAALAEAQQLEEQKAAQKAAEQAVLRKNVTKNVVERVQQKLPFLKGIEGLDLTQIESKASETDPSALHPVDHAFNAVSAQFFPTIVKHYVQLQKEVDHLTDKLAEFENAEPRMSAGTSRSAMPISDNASVAERVSAALASV